MVKRAFDLVVSASALVLLLPGFFLVAMVIRLSSRGPILYCTQRVGLNGAVFTMHKFRTMYVDQGTDPSRLTLPRDPRVYPVGRLLRRLKVDELPQLFDILRGKMSLVGPRPEDLYYVERHYTAEDREVLRVLPGLTSPGTLYDYTHGEQILAQGDAEQMYVEKLLPVRLALDKLYVRQASIRYDLELLIRTLVVMVLMAFGRQTFADPPDLSKIQT